MYRIDEKKEIGLNGRVQLMDIIFGHRCVKRKFFFLVITFKKKFSVVEVSVKVSSKLFWSFKRHEE